MAKGNGLIVACALADNFASGDLFAYAVGRARVYMGQYRAAKDAHDCADHIRDGACPFLHGLMDNNRRTAYEIMSPWRNEFRVVAERQRRQLEATRTSLIYGEC